LDHRERLLRVFHFKDVDRVPDYELCYWNETIDRWHTEGLPLRVGNNRHVKIYFKLDMYDRYISKMMRNLKVVDTSIHPHAPYRSIDYWPYPPLLPVRTGLWPTLTKRILEEKKGRVIMDDGMGGITMHTTETSSIPHYIRHPLKNREDWEKLKPFFNPETPGRFPINWDEIAESYQERDCPLGIGGFLDGGMSLYGWLRNLMGVKNISIAFYRDPDWIAEMMDTLTDLWIKIIRRALRAVKVDFATWWEDMCYSKGPLLSVHHFEEFMVPRYKKVTDVLKEYGVDINILDCDGDITLLVPGWLKAGINCMLPLEARYHNPYELREKFGEKLLLMGGVSKFTIIEGGAAIDNELKRLDLLLQQGGFVPMVDHCVPPDISLENYRYYLKRKRKWIGKNLCAS